MAFASIRGQDHDGEGCNWQQSNSPRCFPRREIGSRGSSATHEIVLLNSFMAFFSLIS